MTPPSAKQAIVMPTGAKANGKRHAPQPATMTSVMRLMSPPRSAPVTSVEASAPTPKAPQYAPSS
jgi:hypothetical protein